MNIRGIACWIVFGFLSNACAEIVSFHDTNYVVYRVNLKTERVNLFWKNEQDMRFQTFGNLKKYLSVQSQTLCFAMNAGIFSPSYEPVGLHVEKGVELHPLNLAAGQGNFFLKPNGVFFIKEGHPSITESSLYPALQASPELGVQSGPLLLTAGKIHPAFNSDSPNRYVRNGVGLTATHEVVLAISQAPITLFEFASFFKEALNCPDALYMDGAISRAYAPADGIDFLDGDFAGILAVTKLSDGQFEGPVTHPTKVGTYRMNDWTYTYAISLAGTRSEQRLGRLFFKGQEIQGVTGEVKECPLGKFKYFGNPNTLHGYELGWLMTLPYNQPVWSQQDKDIKK